MKLEVTQENLAKALATVSRVAQGKTSLPILNNILFRAEKNNLTLVATNLEIAITEKVRTKVTKEGVITIPARLVSDYIANLPRGIISLSLDGTRLHIATDNYSSTLNGTVADEFPEVPAISEPVKLTIKAQLLKKSIQQTILTVSHDETRPILTGVYLHTTEGNLYLAGTDGYRLSERRIMESDHDISAIIPSQTVQDIVRVMPEDCEEVALLISDQQIECKMGDITITSRLIDGKYPDYRQLIPTSSDTKFVADKDEFNRIVKVASLFARESGGSVTISTDKSAKQVSIHSLASQLGENTSALEVEPTSDGAITLNSRYIVEALGVIDSREINFSFSGKLAPCVIKPLGDDAYTHIIMPLKS